MKTRNDLRARIKEEIRPNGIGAITAEAHQELLLELVDILGAEIDEVEAITDVVSDGNYPAMTVGYSDNLVGRGESTPEMFSFRASGGRSINDGTARIKTLHGNAVVFNQMIIHNRNAGSVSGVTFTKEGNTWKSDGTATADAWFMYNEVIKIVKGHKYYYGGCPSNGSTSAFCLWEGSGHILDTGGGNIATLNVDTITPFIFIKSGYNATGLVFKPIFIDLTKMFGAGNEPTTIDEFNARLPLNVDMTAYNEGEVIPFNATAIKSVGDNAWDGLREMGDISGTTGEEFDSSSVWRTADYIRILPNAEYCVEYTSSAFLRARFYDKHKNFIGIVSANNTDIYTNKTFTALNNAYFIRFAPNLSVIPYDSELCVRLVHSGWKQDTGAPFEPYKEFIRNIDNRILELFPNGMHKWDRAYNKNGKGYVVKGTGVVDLGTCSWAKSSSSGIFYFEVLPSVLKDAAYSNNLLCERFATWGGEKTLVSLPDKSLMLYNGASYPLLGVRDSAYTDAASFKAAMQGVMLYYELAEPQVYEFAEPFNLDYEVADFGTEEILASKPSAPLSADIIYQFNAVDSIRDLLTRVASLEARL